MPDFRDKQSDPDRCARCGKSIYNHPTCPHCHGPICDRDVREDWDDYMGDKLNGIFYHKFCHRKNYPEKYPTDGQVRWLFANIRGILWGTPEPPLGDLQFNPTFLAELRRVREKISGAGIRTMPGIALEEGR